MSKNVLNLQGEKERQKKYVEMLQSRIDKKIVVLKLKNGDVVVCKDDNPSVADLEETLVVLKEAEKKVELAIKEFKETK